MDTFALALPLVLVGGLWVGVPLGFLGYVAVRRHKERQR